MYYFYSSIPYKSDNYFLVKKSSISYLILKHFFLWTEINAVKFRDYVLIMMYYPNVFFFRSKITISFYNFQAHDTFGKP